MQNLNLQSYGIYETHMRNILNEIEKKGDGDFFKVDIKSTPTSKMKAKFRNQYLVEKYTTICVRKGVNYKKIKAVKHRNFERMWLGVELPKSKQTTKYPIPSYEKLLLQDEKTWTKMSSGGSSPTPGPDPEDEYIWDGGGVSGW